MKRSRRTTHAADKIETLAKYGYVLRSREIEEAITKGGNWLDVRTHRKAIYQDIDAEHILRIIVEETEAEIVVVTFYPARWKRY